MADYVVSSWEEFLQHNTSGDTVKFANPHEINGEIVLEGNGTQNNPFVVSTYEEMFFATGATYIWEVKLINREQKIYRYEGIYCRYDDSLSTIDFNLIQPEGFANRLSFDADSIDFNGWTFLNLIIKYDMCFINSTGNAYRNGRFLNLIIDSDTLPIMLGSSTYVKYFIFDITTKNTSSQNRVLFNYVPSNSNITIHAHNNVYCKLTSGTSYIYNTVIDLDVSCFWEFGDPSFDTCLITGDCETRLSTNLPLAYRAKYTIYSFNSSYTWAQPQTIQGVTFLNSTKAPNVTSGDVDFKLVTDEVMRSAQDLADLGLPIGVD